MSGPTSGPAALPRVSNPVVGAGWMLLASAGFSVMTGLVRFVADTGMHPWEVAFFRNVFGLMVMGPWIVSAGFAGLKTARLGLYTMRATTGVISMLAWFWSVALMPIAEATALGFTAPLFTTLLAVVVLREVVRLRRWTAVLVGFAGTIVILRPGSGDVMALGAAAALTGAALQAASTIMIKTLARTESPNAIVAYLTIYLTPMSLVPALFVWTTPTWTQLGWLALLGLAGTTAHLCFTRALRAADASMVMPVDFARLIFVSLIGIFVFGQIPSAWTWVGAAIIFASGVYIVRREAIAAREGRAKAVAATEPPAAG
ncbi:MAG: DMT family transporter [Rhodospirillaceae bacterium]|nr:DMT family transporter [Rhodospirillaceae bacterium]